MPNPKPTSLTSGDFDFMELFSTPDKSLDQVKKYLKAQKEELNKLREQGDLQNLARNIKRVALEGFREDLKENGMITEAAQEPYIAEFNKLWEEMQMASKAEAIMSSPEFSAMDEFARRAENLPKLKELIETAKPQAKWQTMLSGILASFPQLEQYLGGDIRSLLAGLGVLPAEEKKEEDKKEEDKKTEADKKKDEKDKDKKEEEKKEEGEPKDGPLDGPEKVPEDFKPGETLILGDSNYSIFEVDIHKKLREKMNATGMLAKGSMQSGWGINQIDSQPKDFFKKFEYVVIGFGSNDMGSTDKSPKIAQRLRSIITKLRDKNPNIKIIMATVPPGKGNKSGEWLTDFEGVEKKRNEVNEFIKMSHRRGLIQGVIDLAAKKEDGGLAMDNDPSTMDKSVRRPGDPVHAQAGIIATAIRRAQYHARNAEVKS